MKSHFMAVAAMLVAAVALMCAADSPSLAWPQADVPGTAWEYKVVHITTMIDGSAPPQIAQTLFHKFTA